MSLVIAVPELMTEAATDLQTIGSTLTAAHLTAAAPTLAVLPAAADEVSASVADLFASYGQEYQKLAGQAAVFYEQFVQHLTASADMYASAEAVNVGLLQPSIPTAEAIVEATGLPESLSNLLDSVFNQINDALLRFGYQYPAWGNLVNTAFAAVGLSVLIGVFVGFPLVFIGLLTLAALGDYFAIPTGGLL